MSKLNCPHYPDHCGGEDCICCELSEPFAVVTKSEVQKQLFWENHICDGDCGDCVLVDDCERG